MSDNKRPYDDEQVNINDLNDDLDKTKVFNLNSKSDNQNTGEYVSKQIDVNGWGKSTVKALSEYILSKEPGIRGYSSQNIWRMKQFYETFSICQNHIKNMT